MVSGVTPPTSLVQQRKSTSEIIDALGYVGRVELGEDSDLLLDVFDLVLGTLEVDDLDRDGLLRTLVVPLVDLSE